MDGVGELARLVHVRMRRFAPDDVGVGGVGEAAADGALDAAVDAVEAFDRALAIDERHVVGVNVGRQQLRAVGIGAGDEDAGHAHDVGRQPRGDELLDELARRHEHLAAHVAALLGRRELILEVNAGRPGLDHRLHQLEGVERTAEARLGVGDDGREPVDAVFLVHVLNLVGAHEGVVDALNQIGHAVGRVEALVGVGLGGGIAVAGHLPAADVDRLQPGLHLLHGLIAGDGPQRRHVILLLHQPPQPLGAHAGQGVLDLHRTAQPHHVLGRVGPGDALPALVQFPIILQLGHIVWFEHPHASMIHFSGSIPVTTKLTVFAECASSDAPLAGPSASEDADSALVVRRSSLPSSGTRTPSTLGNR